MVGKMSASKCEKCPKLTEQYELMDRHSRLKKQMTSLKYVLLYISLISRSTILSPNLFNSYYFVNRMYWLILYRFALSDENLQLMPEFQQRLTVMQKLNYIDQDNTVLLKGRVAREVR